MNKKLNVGILCGGKSAEHEVSLQSAKNIYEALDREKFNPILIGIEKSGRWVCNPGVPLEEFIIHAEDPVKIKLAANSESAVLSPESSGVLCVGPQMEQVTLDVIFPILHGPFGEDGTVQGLLKLVDFPFVGPGVLGSAVGMDKDVMKRLLRDAGVPVGKFLVQRASVPELSFADAADKLGSPLFVKPANMGSSVGVHKVHNEKEYRAALEDAFQFDVKIILEENIPGRELECSVLGNERPEASLPGEVKASRDFYSYEAKYIDPNGAVLEVPARLSAAKIQEIQALAIKTFQVLECQGLSRVDFFMKDDGTVLVNEINTMPGFTKISMYPKLWEAGGIPYRELVTRLIELAIERYGKEKKLKTSR